MKTTFFLLAVFLLVIRAYAQTPQWEFMGLAGEEIYDIVIDDSGNVFVASETGVFKSTDNGASWAFKNNGLIIGAVNKLFIDYDGNIYLGGILFNPGYGLYKSTDGGENWFGIADTLNNNSINYFEDITIIPNEPGGIIYVSNYYGVYRSTDNGITWQSTNFHDPGANGIGINNNGYMFFGNPTASWHGIYRSTDLGLTWIRHTFLGVEGSMVYLRDGSILASAYDPGLGSFGVYKTTNNGDSWFNTNTFSGLTHPFDFVLDKNDDLYASVGYVFLSTNNGNSWLNYGLPGQGAYELAIDSSGYIWSGNHLDGVYRAPGRTTPVELVSFSAEVNGNKVLLKWITATEINNQGFEIERLKDQKIERFNQWEKIGFVEGHGTTTETHSYYFIDKDILSEKVKYRLKQNDYDGTFTYSKIIEVNADLTPKEFVLHQNYPNPFNPTTKIKFDIPQNTNPLPGGERGGLVTLKVYDILGNEVATLVNETKPAGTYEVEFNAEGLSSGVYFYQLKAGSFISTKKFLLLK